MMDYEHPEISEYNKKGYLGRQPKNNTQDDYIKEKDVGQMMIDEVLDEGAIIKIYFDEKDKRTAKRKMGPFKNIGEVECTEDRGENGNINWIKVDDGLVSVTAFYDKEESK